MFKIGDYVIFTGTLPEPDTPRVVKVKNNTSRGSFGYTLPDGTFMWSPSSIAGNFLPPCIGIHVEHSIYGQGVIVRAAKKNFVEVSYPGCLKTQHVEEFRVLNFDPLAWWEIEQLINASDTEPSLPDSELITAEAAWNAVIHIVKLMDAAQTSDFLTSMFLATFDKYHAYDAAEPLLYTATKLYESISEQYRIANFVYMVQDVQSVTHS